MRNCGLILAKGKIFLFSKVSNLALGPTQSVIQWVLGAPSLGVKLLQCEADCLCPSNAEFKNVWSYTSTPLYSLMVCTGTACNIWPILIILALISLGQGALSEICKKFQYEYGPEPVL
jgi:hypothetical protein